MTTGNKPTPTVDEVVALLKKTSIPTIIIEGKDDLIVYKRLEDHFYEQDLTVLPVGGRKKVLEIFDRLHEIPHPKYILFIADKDTWSITGIPQKYKSSKLFFTDGYSIENDVFRDGSVISYMNKQEIATFNEELQKFLTWYSIAINRHLIDEKETITLHPNQILDKPSDFEILTTLKDNEDFPKDRLDEISKDYQRLLRGKSLLQLAIRQLSYTGRPARHSEKSLIEHVAVNPGPLIGRIINDIKTSLTE